MADLQTIQNPQAAGEAAGAVEDNLTEQEFQALFVDAKEGQDRFEALAKAAEAAGHQEIAKVYREVSSTVLGVLADMATASANAILSAEDAIEELQEAEERTTSGLLRDDADRYLQLFDQYLRLLDGLAGIVPPGSEGDQQREVFATLRRLTEGMIEYTKSIIVEPGDDDDDDDDDDPDDDDDDENDA